MCVHGVREMLDSQLPNFLLLEQQVTVDLICCQLHEGIAIVYTYKYCMFSHRISISILIFDIVSI